MNYRKHLFIAGLYTLLTISLTYPVAFRLTYEIAGFKGEDNLQWRWFLWWFKHALLTLQTPLPHLSTLYAPTGGEQPFYAITAYIPALALPLTLLTGPTVAFNLNFLLSFALSGYTTYLLTYYLVRHCPAAFVAGLIFAFYPARFGYATGTFLGQLTTYLLPLYVLGLLLLTHRPTWRRAVWVTVVLTGLCLTWPLHVAYGVILFSLPFFIWQASLWLRRPPTRRSIKYFGLTFGLAALLLLGPYLPLLQTALRGGNNHLGNTGTTYFALDALSFIAPSNYHPLWQSLHLLPAYADRVLADRDDIQERLAYIGFIPALLALVGLIKFGRRLWFWLIIALTAMTLSLGPLLKFNGGLVQFDIEGYVGHIILPYALLRWLPVLDWSGVLGRFNVATMLCMSVMAAYGAGYGLSKVKTARQPALVALVSLLILVEYLTIFPFPTEPDTVPVFYHQLYRQGQTAPQQIVDLPLFGDPSYNNYAMHYQTVHQQPIAGGHFMRKPAGASQMTGFINQLLSPPFDQPALSWPDAAARLGWLNKFGFTKIVARPWLMTEAGPAGQLAYLNTWLGQPHPEGEVLVFEVPPGGKVLPVTALLAGEGWQTQANPALLQLNSPADLLVHVDTDQPLTLQMALSAPEGERYLSIEVNGRPAIRLFLTQETLNYNLPFTLSAGAHQFTFRPQEACEKECLPVNFSRIALEPTAAPPPAPVAFGTEMQLVGVEISAATVAPSQPLLIYLDWQSQTALVKDYSAFVHLATPTGELIGQADYLLGGWLYPTSTWPKGYLFSMPSLMFIPPDAPPGAYQLRVGIYRADTGERLPLTGEQTDFAVLSTLTVEP